jgi:hypothetical protein
LDEGRAVSDEQRQLYERLRQSSAEMLGFDAGALNAVQGLQVDMCSAIRLELDALQSAQLANRPVDIGRLADLVKLLKSLLPSQPLATPNFDHEFDGAFETFATLIENGVAAVEARRVHLSDIEIAKLKAEVEALRAELEVKVSGIAALGGSASTDCSVGEQSPPPQTSNQPPLPPKDAPVPRAYLADHSQPWRPYVDGSGIRAPLPIPGSPKSPRAW